MHAPLFFQPIHICNVNSLFFLLYVVAHLLLFRFLLAEMEADEGIESLASTDGYLHNSHVYMSQFLRQGISQFCLLLIRSILLLLYCHLICCTVLGSLTA